MIKKILMSFVLCLSLQVTAEINAELVKCAAIAKDELRLNCFDALAKQSSTAESGRELVVAEENAAQFGKKKRDDEPDKIHSQIVGWFKGWQKGEVLTLSNGQQWKVVSDSRGYVKLENPEVEIGRGFLDSYNMKVSGLNSVAKVRRVD